MVRNLKKYPGIYMCTLVLAMMAGAYAWAGAHEITTWKDATIGIALLAGLPGSIMAAGAITGWMMSRRSRRGRLPSGDQG